MFNKVMDVNDIELPAKMMDKLMSDEEKDEDDIYEKDDVHHSIGDELAEEAKEEDDIIKDEEFNEEGFNETGFNKDGFNKDGFDEKGFDVNGKDSDGNEKAEDEVEYDEDGFNPDGFNKDGFNADGETEDGRGKEDFTEGFDKKGFDPYGFDKDGKDKDGKLRIDPNEEPLEKEQSSNEDKPLDFKAISDGEQIVKVKTEDGKEVNLKDILQDYTNDIKWKKVNTEKDQKVAEDRKVLESDRKVHDETVVAFEDIVKKLSDKDFLEGAEEHFGDEKNPVTALLKAVKDGKSALANREQQAEKDEQELIDKQDTDIKDQVDAIREDDSSYNDMNKMQDLFDIANELKVSLPVAYDLNKVPLLTEQLKSQKTESEKTIKELTDSKAGVEKELKERNKEVAELKKNPKPKEPKHDKKSSKGASVNEEIDDSPVDGWKATAEKVKELLGVK